MTALPHLPIPEATSEETSSSVPRPGDEELAAVLYRVVHEAPPPLSARSPRVPPRLAAAVERALAGYDLSHKDLHLLVKHLDPDLSVPAAGFSALFSSPSDEENR